MNLQFIHDNKGNTTGVFIPIEEWQSLKERYAGLQKEEAVNVVELSTWQTEVIDQRLNDYYANPADVENFDDMLYETERHLRHMF